MVFSVKKVLTDISQGNGIFEYHLKNNYDISVAVFRQKWLAVKVAELLNKECIDENLS